MRGFRNSLLIIVIFLIAGFAFHYGMHRKVGFLVWSAQKDGESGKVAIVRTEPKSPLGHGERIEDVLEESASGTPAETAGDGDELEGAPVIKDPPPAPESKKKPAPPKDPNLISLFDGKSLGKWESIEFGGEGEVFVNQFGGLEVEYGAIMTGVRWTGDVPRTSNYEISLDAMLIDGNDFFCGLTFPVKESHASLIVGGWGGGVVGISSVDDLDASENETMNIEAFEEEIWYKIKVKVTDEKLEAWIDDRQMVDLELQDRKISLRYGDIELCAPLGICSYITAAQYRNIQWRNLPEKVEEPAGERAGDDETAPGASNTES